MRTRARLMVSALVLAALGASGWAAFIVLRSLPTQEGVVVLPGLTAAVRVDSDHLGIPTIVAGTREDAYRALGFLHARDRFFQMDLARRKSAGELAALFGAKALDLDRSQRIFQARKVLRASISGLVAEQQQVLSAYADGVNRLLAESSNWPLEVVTLGYVPAQWRSEDSLLVAFGMFQTLTSQSQDERMLTVMEQALPREVVAFLTPDVDEFSVPLLGGRASRRPSMNPPLGWLTESQRSQSAADRVARVDAEERFAGSNQWAVSGRRTKDGRAMVANDMHLTLGIPNIWYRAELQYSGGSLSGVTLPGLPLIVAGSNGTVAWGYTNVDSDVIDLVKVEVDPDDPERYLGPGRSLSFERDQEIIEVRGAHPERVDVRRTIWGPVLHDTLLGSPVALHWTALKSGGMNLDLLDIDRANTLEQAIEVHTHSGIPPQNVVLADRAGHIAWTLAGRFPKRRGFDGSTARSWADGARGWDGFIAPDEHPRLVDPASGFIATANNRTLGLDYPHVLGHNFSHSYRAYRIQQRLAAMGGISEPDMLDLQLDTTSEFFEFYRQMALALIAPPNGSPTAAQEDLRRTLESWDGGMNAGSRGIALLVRWRQRLAQAVFAPWVARCVEVDPGFAYAWREMETPLRALLRQRAPEALPDRSFTDWKEFLLAELTAAAETLKADYRIERIAELDWAQVNRVQVRHPFGKLQTWLSPLLDMPEAGLPGCSSFCVRILSGESGASERFVVSPGRHAEGLFHMPGGQSGHPFSPNYRDQQRAWAEGRALPFAAGVAEHTMRLVPR